MKNRLQISKNKFKELSTYLYLKAFYSIDKNLNAIMFLVGAALLYGGISELASAEDGTTILRKGMCTIVLFLEGSLGALMSIIAGILVLIATALGGFKTAHTLLFVTIGAFIIRSLISLFFGNDIAACAPTPGTLSTPEFNNSLGGGG